MFKKYEFSFDAARKCEINGREVHHGKSFVWGIQCNSNYDEFQKKCISINNLLHNSYLNSMYLECDDQSLLNTIYQELKNIGEHTLKLKTSYGFLLFDGTYWKVQVDKVISCAHFLPNVEKGHKCGSLHGHDFAISVLLLLAPKGSLDDLVTTVLEKLSPLENTLLNDIKGLENPTSEIFSKWIYYKHKSKIINILEVTILETKTAGSTFDGSKQWKSHKNFDMECAIPFNGGYSGHSYQVTLGIAGDINLDAGWSIDFSVIKALFKEDYKIIDHHELGELLDCKEMDCFKLAKFVFDKMKPKINILTYVEVKGLNNETWNYKPW